MDTQYFDEIVSIMQPFLTDKGFAPIEGESYTYKNEKLAIRIVYNDNRKLFELHYSALDSDGVPVDYSCAASWLFDDNHNANDTRVIAEDFEETTLGLLGIKRVRSYAGNQVDLPSKAAAGETPNIDAFTERFLALAPQYKDAYKEHVSKNGEYLYLDFLKKTAAVKLREVVDSGNKKQIEKYFAMLGKMYYDGDSTVSNTVVGIIIAGAFRGNAELFLQQSDYMADYPYLKSAGLEIINLYKKDKKFAAALEV